MTIPSLRVLRPIQEEIKHHFESNNYTFKKLSELTKINSGHLYGVLKGERDLTVDQLDSIGKAFEQSAGWLYDLYIDECFPNGKIATRRVKDYLIHCAEIGRKDYIKLVVDRLPASYKTTNIFFDVAGILFRRGRQKESAYFYQLVIDNEKTNRTQRFVLSHYRLFLASVSEKTNTEEIWRAVAKFEPYWKRLEEGQQLDALLQLAGCYKTLNRWVEVGKYADKLLEQADSIYDQLYEKKRDKNKITKGFKLENNLVAYYGQGYMLKIISLERQGLYEQAKVFVGYCTDLGWFELLDETGRVEVEKYKHFALEYSFRLDMLKGNTSMLYDYVEYLREYPDSVLSGLITILESANKHGFIVDDVLDEFSDKIDSFGYDPTNVDYHLQFRYQFALYLFKNGRFQEGIVETLRCFNLATILNSNRESIKCVAFFETHREHATPQQEQDYKLALREVINDGRINGCSYPPRKEHPSIKH
ncbi:putative DNA-binding protein [Brevibacillus phage SecTim467]|uniref:Putative DNA-binding protein n=1 Tax=Brevibacillus phage SecTim467 TaxID=1691956 RepID=A0A0K2CP77_9CAUD|nr:putative DNA-binding protein [Brevibacillus phage SecTim467]